LSLPGFYREQENKEDLAIQPNFQYNRAKPERTSMNNIVEQEKKNKSNFIDGIRFIQTIFDPNDIVILRNIETWTEQNEDGEENKKSKIKGTWYWKADDLTDPSKWESMEQRAEMELANQFFGVCPRAEAGEYDLACQIRLVRCLWADIDLCTVDEAKARCQAAGIVQPTIIVASGHGVHLYWILKTPYLIEDAYQGQIKTKWTNGKPSHLNAAEEEVKPRALVSYNAKYIQRIQQTLAGKLGADHTQDLVRLLRLPSTMNRKNQVNGATPVECRLVELNDLRYTIEDFPAPEEKKSTTTQHNINCKADSTFEGLLEQCKTAEDRSKADYALLCHAKTLGMEPDTVWAAVENYGKFEQRGRDYFDITWDKAKIDEKLQLQLAGEKVEEVIGADSSALEDGNTEPEYYKQSLEQTDKPKTPEDKRRGYLPKDLMNMPDPTWLVEKHFTVRSFNVVFGEYETGKTFIALDMGLSIATGKAYLGQYAVKKGAVAYVVGEGTEGIKKRIWTWCKHYDIDINTLDNFCAIPFQFNMTDPEHKEPIRLLKIICDTLGCMPEVIFFDTLNRHFGSGDPDKQSWMNQYNNNLGRIQEITGGSVVSIHHIGKDPSRGPIGSNVLPGACDSMIQVAGDVHSQVRVSAFKKKDGAGFADYYLTMKHYNVPFDKTEEGSLVLLKMDKDATRDDLTPVQRKTLILLQERFGQNVFTLAEAKEMVGKGCKSTLHQHLKLLVNTNYLYRDPYRINPDVAPLIKRLQDENLRRSEDQVKEVVKG